MLEIRTISGAALTRAERFGLIALCSRAYEEDIAPLWRTFERTSHVVGYFDGRPVSHALWVTRWLQVGAGSRLLRTAYVELVATDVPFRGRGFAAAIMARLAEEIQGFDLGALSPFSVEYYVRLGWEQWRGPLFIRTAQGSVASPADEEVMILRLEKTPPLDVFESLSAEWREGELW